ncbi:hypothetical protein AB1K91_17745 [Terribacillus sp. 179-K 1B1 HS]|uniref:hypothetical protein n=1 Tax=Terribacillus sp. 179-K 1B1 HS TaxID=3142388 RepID=UPI0039A03B6D
MKTYKVRDHAVQRAVERFGWKRTGADNRLVQLMQQATYHGTTSRRGGESRVFDHYKSGVRIIVDKDSDTIRTCYPIPSILDTVPSELSEAIRKKAATLSRKYTKELRGLERDLTSVEFEIARRNLNKLRVNNPKTKAFIDAKLTELADMRDKLTARQSELTEQLAELAKHQ